MNYPKEKPKITKDKILPPPAPKPKDKKQQVSHGFENDCYTTGLGPLLHQY